MLFSQQINQLYKDTVLEVLLLFINMLSFLALFPSPLLSKPRGAEPGNEASYSTDVPNTCVNTQGTCCILSYLILLEDNTHYSLVPTLARVNADRYCCVLFYLFSIQVKSILLIQTGISLYAVLSLCYYRSKDPFYTFLFH